MKKVKIKLEKSADGDWWVQSDEFMGLIICGETKEEVLSNAKFTIAMELDIDEKQVDLEIIETKLIEGDSIQEET